MFINDLLFRLEQKISDTLSAIRIKIVSDDGNGISITNGKVDVNAELNTTGLATSDNQVSGSQKTQVVDETNTPINFATEDKQDSIITELQQKTEPTDIQLGELIPVLRSLITAVANPSYVDKSANQMRAQVTGSLTTLTTVTTVTNLSNIGSFSADHLQRMANINAWAANVRNLIT